VRESLGSNNKFLAALEARLGKGPEGPADTTNGDDHTREVRQKWGKKLNNIVLPRLDRKNRRNSGPRVLANDVSAGGALSYGLS